MMLSATCKKIFCPIQIPEKGILGAKTWLFFIKNSENWNLFKKFPVVTVEFI